jgi:hypothetical protein
MEEVKLNLLSIPEFIKRGSLFQSLYLQEQADDDDQNDHRLYVPAKYCQFNLSDVTSVVSATELCSTLRYWGVEDIPPELVTFLLDSPLTAEDLVLLKGEHQMGDSFAFLLDLQKLRRMDVFNRLLYVTDKGNLSLLRYLLTPLHDVLDYNLSHVAVTKGHLHCLRYLHERGYLLDANTCSTAARGGHLHCLQYAHEHGCPWDKRTCDSAAYGGHLQCLQYAYENGCPWDEYTCTSAAQGGRLHCLQHLHEQGCPWDEYTCSKAAEGGHLDCLQYVHQQGCPWNEDTCSAAAQQGHLKCLHYAHENGCPWDAGTCSKAVLHGNHICMGFALNKKSQLAELAYEDVAHLVLGQLDCLRYALEHGCPREGSLFTYCSKFLAFAKEHGCSQLSGDT